ncbi:MAG TPA: ATP-binding protein [Candidatus Fimivivens faecavium]|nr:ATP-binding protein [Candidatus Fimivivens faecavium]
MSEPIILNYQVSAADFSHAGEASSNVKKTLKSLGFPPEVVRRVAIAMYEGEINMVIHAHGGEATASITPEEIEIILKDVGPGIPDIPLAMQEGYSTASDSVRGLGFGAGMGLPNMKRYTDFLQVNSVVGEGTTVRMIIRP